MKKLKSIEPKVEAALRNNPQTRKDDFILVLEVFKNYIPMDLSIATALKHHIEYGLPSFASVIRVRRMLQAKDPSLCDTETIIKRADAEADYKEYSKEDQIQ